MEKMRELYQNLSAPFMIAAASRFLNYCKEHDVDHVLEVLLPMLKDARDKVDAQMYRKKPDLSCLEESKALSQRVIALKHLLVSYRYTDVPSEKEHAEALLTFMKRLGGIAKKNESYKMTRTELLLEQCSEPGLAEHVAALPGVNGRLSDLRVARNALQQRRLEVDMKSATMPKKEPLPELKMNLAAIFNRIGNYLDTMTLVDAETYQHFLNMYNYLVKEENANYKSKRKKRAEDAPLVPFVVSEDSEDFTKLAEL